MSWAIGNIKQSGNHLLSGKKQAEQHPGGKKSFYLNILNKVSVHRGKQTETNCEGVESISALSP